MNYIEYKRLKDKAEFGTGAEAAAATKELNKINARDRWQYNKWQDAEDMGIDPFATSAPTQAVDKPVSKPTEAVKTARVSKPTKTATKGKDKPAVTMTYDQFKRNFNNIGKCHLYNPDGKSPMVRLSELARHDPKQYQEYRDRMRMESD